MAAIEKKVNISRIDWDCLKLTLKQQNMQSSKPVTIEKNDVFRITKMAYKDGYLLIFLTGYLQENYQQLFQCYVEVKSNLYSYKFCYNNHAFNSCSNNCKSYKAFVMPGIRNVYMEKFNVIKYKRSREDDGKYAKKPLDYFLRDINRVHMQTNLKEGQYVKFCKRQVCTPNKRVNCENFNDADCLKNLFHVMDMAELKKEIVPVVVSYDIETHSNGYKFSNAQENNVISISVVMHKNGVYTKICLYYMCEQAVDDLTDKEPIKSAKADLTQDKIFVVRFNDELEMLKGFFDLLPLLNGDYVLDYNGDKFDLPYILDRIKVLHEVKLQKNRNGPPSVKRIKLSEYEKDCAIRRYDLDSVTIDKQVLHDKFNNKINNHLLMYYVHVDLYQFLSSDPEHKNLENFQLNTVSEHYLEKNKIDLTVAEMLNLYNNNCIKKIIEYNVQDSILPIELLLKLKIIEFLYTQCILLFLCTDDLLSNISHKISIVFFHMCINNTSPADPTASQTSKQIPDPFIFNKNDLNITSGKYNTPYSAGRSDADDAAKPRDNSVDLKLLKRKPIPLESIPSDAIKLSTVRPVCNYKGGKVLSPKAGLKKWVVTLDFNSLYLTIMMYEGACFSNLFIGADDNVYLLKDMNAINSKLLHSLLDMRSVYKKKRDEYESGTFLYDLHDTLQNAVKRIANSIYGYFGIYFKVLANYITKIGRNKLMEAIRKIEAMSQDETIKSKFNLSTVAFRVIYGDTDSSFIQVLFDEKEIAPDVRHDVIQSIINDHVLKNLNASWAGMGYKMALENVMSNLILLKKKKYCYLNSQNKIKYKGWLIKKDMPIFMRKTFRAVVDSFLKNHSVACGLRLLDEMLIQYYTDFSEKDVNLNDYCFSMSYNENSTSKKKVSTPSVRKPVVTIARHCRELMLQANIKNLPGNGDRIPFLLIDIKESITKKAYPVALFKANNKKISWLKHMNILCNFINELMEIFGRQPAFEYYFDKICTKYMENQKFDVKFPILKVLKNKMYKSPKKENDNETEEECENDDDDDSDDDIKQPVEEYVPQFRLCVKNNKRVTYTLTACSECKTLC
ncbi:dna polymerase [Sucra jujuba nucleopolyhedrovirus]|uniref:DNA-directed DNA polymerase n=1 Tax=Sucra jujuba nucleopolyhedrovirus TaxID=1563660 RepID=A0A097P8Z6_9ABAC|nr:dna polymerase [Sucra jujuba nucleopolyhedrovirus]AIU41302.1 dna polymerase [Sucra jujuba nucleopolyhedrovirus]